MSRWFPLVICALVAACDPPSPAVTLFFSQGPALDCGTTDCQAIAIDCDLYVGVRILDPSQPITPFYTQCEPLPTTDRKKNACALNSVKLENLPSFPYRDLEFQFALFPASMITTDPHTNLPLCPSDVQYDMQYGFPSPSTPVGSAPAVGGSAYYHPGDDTINVTLGCSDMTALSNDECLGISDVTFHATVDDFDTHISVGNQSRTDCSPSALANCLTVQAGEPHSMGEAWVLTPGDLSLLTKNEADPPSWAGRANAQLNSTACATVLEDGTESTSTVSCKDHESLAVPIGPTTDSLNLVGVRLSKTSLDQILAAAGLTSPPEEGITIGVVLNNGSPLGGQTVQTDPAATIEYVNAGRTGIGGASTSSGANGAVFIARDAPYKTVFSSQKLSATAKQIGGRVQGKVTIVVLDVGITSTGMN